jgi:hypothetical protein
MKNGESENGENCRENCLLSGWAMKIEDGWIPPFFLSSPRFFLLIGLIAERLALKPERLMRQIRNDKRERTQMRKDSCALVWLLAAERADCPSSSYQATLGFVLGYCLGLVSVARWREDREILFSILLIAQVMRFDN